MEQGGTTINRTGPYPTASDSPDRTPTMTSYKYYDKLQE